MRVMNWGARFFHSELLSRLEWTQMISTTATAFSDSRSPDRSSTNFMHLNGACVCHKNVVMFKRGKDGKIYRAYE